jgi:hypothetical protein
MKNIFYLSVVVALFVISCKKKTEEVVCAPGTVHELHLQPTLNALNYNINDVIESPQGYKYYYTDIKILGTNVGNGSVDFAADYLYDYAETGTILAKGSGELDAFKNLSFNIGVPQTLNHADPSLSASSSALNPINVNGMHWGWNPGYIFVTIEGKADTIADGIDNFDHSFFFHLGMDVLFKTKTLTDVTWVADGDKQKATLKLQMNEILDGTNATDLRVNYVSHSANTQMAYSLIIMNEFVAAIKK